MVKSCGSGEGIHADTSPVFPEQVVSFSKCFSKGLLSIFFISITLRNGKDSPGPTSVLQVRTSQSRSLKLLFHKFLCTLCEFSC